MGINMVTIVGKYEGMNWEDLLLNVGREDETKIIPIRVAGNMIDELHDCCEVGKTIGVKGSVDIEIGTGVIIRADRISIIK